eukprot:62142-Prorocentrum_minimum.AAC.1
MLPPLTRLVPAAHRCSLPSRDWFLVCIDAPSPHVIGSWCAGERHHAAAPQPGAAARGLRGVRQGAAHGH